MAILKYINNNNKSIELGNAAPFLVTTIDGLGSPQNEIYTQKSPYQDGVTATHSSLGPRNIVIEGKIIDSNRENRQAYRYKLLSIFNPKLDGKLIIDLGSAQRQIDCKVEQAPYFSSNSEQNYQNFSISLLAPNPYWQDINTTEEEIVTWISGISFPLQLPTQFATAGPKKINIINSGDIETPIKLEITGTATNPKILKRLTGEFIKVNRTLTTDDTLVITTDFGNKRVEQNGVNVFNYIDLNSTFFSLDVGDNVIELTTDDVTDNANIKISYRNRYLGV